MQGAQLEDAPDSNGLASSFELVKLTNRAQRLTETKHHTLSGQTECGSHEQHNACGLRAS